MEMKRRPLPDYIEKIQKDISADMRGVLVDWLVEVAEEYKLLSETLYLTISFIDRFLSINSLHWQRLPLLAQNKIGNLVSELRRLTLYGRSILCHGWMSKWTVLATT
ncbi:Putative cyclin-A3-1 [Ancistrocladus abbreviatus]